MLDEIVLELRVICVVTIAVFLSDTCILRGFNIFNRILRLETGSIRLNKFKFVPH